jgi:proline iminopeptidase
MKAAVGFRSLIQNEEETMTPITRRDAITGISALTLAAATVTSGARPSLAAARTGKVAVSGGNVTYWIMGEGRGVPLLMIHGGPGGTHDYMMPLAALGKDRPLVFWDQLDCGESDHPHNPANWTIERYVSEIDSLRDALGLTELHLFGSSYGGLFAAEYSARQPKGLKSCIMAGPSISFPQEIEDKTYLVKLLPEDAANAILKNEAADNIRQNETYERAVQVWMQRHLCRAHPWPADLQATFKVYNMDLNNAMIGPYLTRVAGSVGTYDGSSKLAKINVPTLLTYGEFDMLLSGTMCNFHHMIAGSQLYRTKDGSHLPWLEFPEDYNKTVAGFLAPLS